MPALRQKNIYKGEAGMKEIPLTQGTFAIVDDEDYEWLNKYKWFLSISCSSAYATRSARREEGRQHTIFMHREILQCDRGFVIDHKNGNHLDNRRSNLRVATRSQNAANAKKRRTGSSRYKGVAWYKPRKQWISQITRKGLSSVIGFFDDEIDAAKAYDAAALEEYGEFARPNFPQVKL